jgi:quercetin dioxygenase-like cupin family protein
MKRMLLFLGVASALVVALSLLGGRMLSAQDLLKSGTVLQRTELISAKGMEAILVLRELPPGGESGKHTQSGNEIVYIMEGG